MLTEDCSAEEDTGPGETLWESSDSPCTQGKQWGGGISPPLLQPGIDPASRYWCNTRQEEEIDPNIGHPPQHLLQVSQDHHQGTGGEEEGEERRRGGGQMISVLLGGKQSQSQVPQLCLTLIVVQSKRSRIYSHHESVISSPHLSFQSYPVYNI